MPITAEKLRELASLPEGPRLDFKEFDYSWAGDKKAANAELAKDLMAMANGLSSNASPAYILVGVADDGGIVGIAEHCDDAALHEKVQHLLNRTPRFSYAVVHTATVAGAPCTVGVYEISGGERPYYPLKQVGSLRRHVAFCRDGSATRIATPTEIQAWVGEDDPDAQLLRARDLRRAEAESQVRARLCTAPLGLHAYSNDYTRSITVENIGLAGFTICRGTWRIEWNARCARRDLLPATYAPPCGELRIPEDQRYVPTGAVSTLRFEWTRADAIEHLRGTSVSGFQPSWVDCHIELECNGDLGGRATLSHLI